LIENVQPTTIADTMTSSGVNRLIKNLKSKQRELWLQGQPEPVEDLLKGNPELAGAPEAFSLVYGEYLLREESRQAAQAG